MVSAFDWLRFSADKHSLKTSFWRFTGAFNILTDAALIVAPIAMLRYVSLKPTKKLVVLACFGVRLL